MKKVLKFYADWCQPCKMLTKTLQDIKTDIPIEEINIDENVALTKQYNIRGIPAMVMLDGDEVVKSMSGTRTQQELEKWLNG